MCGEPLGAYPCVCNFDPEDYALPPEKPEGVTRVREGVSRERLGRTFQDDPAGWERDIGVRR